MIILITGIHGFIGSNLVNSLKVSHKLYGLDIITDEKEGVLRTYNWKDLTNIPPVDAIIHLAGKAHDTQVNKDDSKLYFDINTGLTKIIFDWFVNSSARKFIFFSSVKAVADKLEGEELSEYSVPYPVGPYGESKYLAETYLSQFFTSEKKVYILRPCMIHGPGNKGNLNLLFKMQRFGFPWLLGAFENKRSFCSIDNVLYVIKNLIERNIESGIYNVADDDPVSTNKIIQLISESLNKKNTIWRVSPDIVRSLSKFGDLLGFPLNSQRLSKLTESYIVSNQKIKKALGIEKMPVDSIDGLKMTLKLLKENNLS